MTSLTRGPLPPSVYWRRRLAVLSVGLLVAVGAGKVLGDGSDGSDPDQATTVSARAAASGGADATVTPLPSDAASATTSPAPGLQPLPGAEATEERGKRRGEAERATPEPVLAEPQGRCDSADVAVTPEVPEAVAGQDVAVVLNLRTVTTPACTWRLSPAHLTVNITSGNDDIWSTRQCRRALPGEEVVIGNNVTTAVVVTWQDAARMDDECARIDEWALPGYYHATAAALGGEPSDVQFRLEAPSGPSASDGATSDKRKPKRR